MAENRIPRHARRGRARARGGAPGRGGRPVRRSCGRDACARGGVVRDGVHAHSAERVLLAREPAPARPAAQFPRSDRHRGSFPAGQVRAADGHVRGQPRGSDAAPRRSRGASRPHRCARDGSEPRRLGGLRPGAARLGRRTARRPRRPARRRGRGDRGRVAVGGGTGRGGGGAAAQHRQPGPGQRIHVAGLPAHDRGIGLLLDLRSRRVLPVHAGIRGRRRLRDGPPRRRLRAHLGRPAVPLGDSAAGHRRGGGDRSVAARRGRSLALGILVFGFRLVLLLRDLLAAAVSEFLAARRTTVEGDPVQRSKGTEP